MKKGMNLIVLAAFIFLISLSFASASCTVKGYAFNLTGSIINSTNYPAGALINGKCAGPNTQCINAPTSSTGLYSCSLGVITNCASCASIYLNATNSTLGVWGTANITSPAALATIWQNITLNNTPPVPDTAAPTYSNINEPTDPSAYGTGPYKFNISWNDASAVDEVILTFDNLNYSYKGGGVSKVSGITGNAIASSSGNGFFSKIYYSIKNFFLGIFGITGKAVSEDGVIFDSGVYSYTFSTLPAGIYNYRWFANDTGGYANSTGTLSITISKAGNPVLLTIQGSSGNKIVTYPTTSDAAASGIGVCLYRNNALISCSDSSVSENIVLANGTYNYFANATGNANYSANSTGISYSLAVNKASPSLSLSSSGTWSITANVSTTFTCTSNNAEANVTLYEDNAFLNTSASDTVKYSKNYSSTGNFEIKCNRSESQNYSGQSTSNTLAVAAPSCSDGIQNQDETGVDCGGAICSACSAAGPGGGGGGGGAKKPVKNETVIVPEENITVENETVENKTAEKQPVCGDKTCDASEKNTCCSDCGCNEKEECKDNICVKLEEKAKPSLPAYTAGILFGSTESIMAIATLAGLISWLAIFKIIKNKGVLGKIKHLKHKKLTVKKTSKKKKK